MQTPEISPVITIEISEETRLGIERLRAMLQRLRPAIDAKKAKDDDSLMQLFSAVEIAAIKRDLMLIFKEADFTSAISGSGIPSGSSFADETIRIIKGKILPYLHNPKDACRIIHEIFNQPGDHERIVKLLFFYPEIEQVFNEEEKKEIVTTFLTQVTNSVHIISYRIAALGMDEDVYIRAGKDDTLITPFMEQNHEITELLTNIEKGNTEKIAEDLAQTKLMIRHCIENIAVIDKGAEKNGTSLRQTFLLRKLELLITRLTSLLPIICYEDIDKAFTDLMSLLREIIVLETKRQKLRDFVSRNINLIAYRITENKRKTGEHYVATGQSEYWELFISACGGGFIVSFMVLIKLMIHEMHLPMLWEGIFYSISYAAGFIAIQMLGFTLATKQPAMTAAFLAASLDDIKDDASRYHHLADTVAKVSRSQLVSFAGNLFVVFPCTLLWVFTISQIMHKPFVSATEGNDLLMAVHPLHSLSFLYASIAGVFLFMTGIISGFGDNKVVVSKIGLRLEAHPFLKRRLSDKARGKFSSYIEKNLGPILGNTILGFLLGMAGFVGKITGLPFDIRHITFSTGNIAMGFYGINFHASARFVIAILAGVVIIGVFNFAVSFFLALQVAARSRGLRLRDYPAVTVAILSHLKKHPMRFVFPEMKHPVEVPAA